MTLKYLINVKIFALFQNIIFQGQRKYFWDVTLSVLGAEGGKGEMDKRRWTFRQSSSGEICFVMFWRKKTGESFNFLKRKKTNLEKEKWRAIHILEDKWPLSDVLPLPSQPAAVAQN